MKLKQNLAFLCYAHEDIDQVEEIYKGLTDREVNVWFDKKRLKVGRWKSQIEKAIARSRYFIICLSEAALRKTGEEPGFQDDELNRAYNIAQEQPSGDFTIIPVRLEECGRGDHRMTGFQQYDLFREWNLALDRLAVQLGGSSLIAGELQDEQSYLEKALQQFRGRAMAYHYAGDYSNGLRIWDSLEVLYGASVESLFWKGFGLYELEQHEAALQAYEEAFKLSPENTGVLINKGVILSKMGRSEESLRCFDRAIELESDSHLAMYNKAVVLKSYDREREIEEALVQYFSRNEESLKSQDSSDSMNDLLHRVREIQDQGDSDKLGQKLLEILSKSVQEQIKSVQKIIIDNGPIMH